MMEGVRVKGKKEKEVDGNFKVPSNIAVRRYLHFS